VRPPVCSASALLKVFRLTDSPPALPALRLIDLVAEDAAISDTIYQLNRALNAERIDLERFLKMTRILASDQFRCRALIEKILRG